MQYKEIHPTYTASGYGAINEEPEMFTHMLGKHKLGKMCSIASAGEMLYLAFLPKATSILAVDHSYRSLAASMMKGHAIKRVGIAKFKEMVLRQDYVGFCKEVGAALENIPAEVRAHVGVNAKGQTNNNTPSGTCAVSSTDFSAMKRDWYYSNDRLIARVDQMLDKLTFMHGDMILDAAKEGPFDSIYVSNMCEHSGRNKIAPQPKDFFKLLKLGGKLLGVGMAVTSSVPAPGTNNYVTGWESLDLPPQPAMRGTSWTYAVLVNKLTPDYAFKALRGEPLTAPTT